MTNRIAEIRAKCETRQSPRLVLVQNEIGSLNAPIEHKMIAVPDPDLDGIWLCDRLERAEKLLEGTIRHGIHVYDTDAIRAFLAGDR